MSEIAGNWGEFVTALIAVILLAQGQRDRRRLRQGAARSQAEQVMVVAETTQIPITPTSARLTGSSITILNESDQAIQLKLLTLVRAERWEDVRQRSTQQPDTANVPLSDPLLRPRGEIVVPLPDGWHLSSAHLGSDFAVVSFVDAHDQQWWRRTDTNELMLTHSSINTAQKTFQRLTHRLPIARQLLTNLPIKIAQKSVDRHLGRDRLPLALLWVRVSHGYWPPGGPAESSPWTRPVNAPVWWGYNGLGESAGR